MKLQKEVLLEQSDADAEYTGGDGQCHFPQCSKDVCPVDGCQTHWESTCKGPRPAVYVADGHSGSSIITAALANLTGSFVSPWAPYWPELFGDTVQKALDFMLDTKPPQPWPEHPHVAVFGVDQCNHWQVAQNSRKGEFRGAERLDHRGMPMLAPQLDFPPFPHVV